jgi:colanic acid/amylovoran biosynthesis glycosyltransferase
MKIAYILESFPNVSTTFIINEIIEMQDKGLDIEVYAFFDPAEKVVHAKVKRIKKIRYFKSNFSGMTPYLKILFSHFYWFFRSPYRYLRTGFMALFPNNGLLKLFITALPYVSRVHSNHPDILHAHFGRRPADFCMLVKLLTGTPFTFTTHGFDVHSDPAKNYRLKTSLSVKQITISYFNKRAMVDKFKVPAEKIEVIRCGVDFKYPLPAPGHSSENMIISVARLEYIKGLDVLIRACGMLSDEGVRYRCAIVGDGPLRERLKNLVSELKLKNKVTLLGPRTHDEVFALLGGAGVMVLPSRSESLSVALMEAMACGVPVIGPDIMGNPELVQDGVTGFLVSPDNVEEVFNKTKLLLTDKTLRKKFSVSARAKVFRDFNLFKETEKLFHIWQEALL